jgi:hypothetical protein
VRVVHRGIDLGGEPAVDGERGSGGVAGTVAREVLDGDGHVFDAAVMAEGGAVD